MFDWQWFFVYYFVVWQVTFGFLTVYLHRYMAHKSISVTPVVQNVGRFVLWVQGFYWPNWAQHWCAIHRKHHKFSDTKDDPHSPHFMSFGQIFDNQHYEPGRPYYLSPDEIKQYAADVPVYDDWMEHNVYAPYMKKGIFLFHAINFVLFGIGGLLLSIIGNQAFRKATLLHNYASHKIGYRLNKSVHPGDKSVNVFPIGLLWGGEEFGANHHDAPGNPKFSKRWWEFDPGWGWIKLLDLLQQIKFNPVAKGKIK